MAATYLIWQPREGFVYVTHESCEKINPGGELYHQKLGVVVVHCFGFMRGAAPGSVL